MPASLQQALRAGHPLEPYLLSATLRVCGDPPCLPCAQQLHALSLKTSLTRYPSIAAGLVHLYHKCRQPNSALRLFRCMRAAGDPPDPFTFPPALASAPPAALRQLHGFLIRSGHGGNLFVRSSLVHAYAKGGDTFSAEMALREGGGPVAWNSLMAGLVRAGRASDALHLFVEMRRRGFPQDEFSFTAGINATAAAEAKETGRAIHGEVVKGGFFAGHVANALIDMYAQVGCFRSARSVFDEMSSTDVVSWTALISGCATNGLHEPALELFKEMFRAGIGSDEVTAAAVLSCCAAIPAPALGEQVHAVEIRRGGIASTAVGNALISMYAKAGASEEAQRIFEEMPCQDAVSWTALLLSCAQNGAPREALRLYRRMVGECAERPDYVTFIAVLFACSRAGLEADGREIFGSMERVHGVAPGPEHYACMVDLLGRMGKVSEAAALLHRCSFRPDVAAWKALLAGACRIRGGELAVAEHAATELLQAQPEDATAYVLLSNSYAAERRWADVGRVRQLMRAHGVRKEPGWSWVEAEKKVHAFTAGDSAHPRAAEVYAKVGEMMERTGYKASMGWALHDGAPAMELEHHSEKLAVAFGLLSLPDGAPIRVFKNLRICGDCHHALKAVAKVYRRAIVVRDPNYFHHFGVDGLCSCGDFW